MADSTRPPSDPKNLPADAKLLQQRPELFDKSLAGQVEPPAPAVSPVAPVPEVEIPALSQDPPADAGEALTEPEPPAPAAGDPETSAGAVGEDGQAERAIVAPGAAGEGAPAAAEPTASVRKPGQPRKPGVPKR